MTTKPPVQEMRIDAHDQAAIEKAMRDFVNQGYVVSIVRPENSNLVTIKAKDMNPKFHPGFELED